MIPIEIDEDVFAQLQNIAKPFIDTPNSVLRRLLRLETLQSEAIARSPESLFEAATRRSKAPKADLRVLVDAGVLRNGQELTLLNHSHEPQKYKAKINGSGLDYEKEHFSMSALAQKLLMGMGFADAAVRGPAHWATAEGAAVSELWQRHLDKL